MILDIVLLTLSIVLLLCYSFFLFLVLRGINRVKNEKSGRIPHEFISVIIPFRNESDNILLSLKSIANQDYPPEKYEVIYINDCSEDDSIDLICSAEKPGNIRILTSAPGPSGKHSKAQALQYAIQESRGDIIVSTDCDCFHEPNWLSSLLSYYDSNTAFISGPVAFKHNETLFEILQSIEFGGLVLTGAGLLGSDTPVICNAANLSFRKNVYEKLKENSGDFTPSGDSEFLMREIASKTKFKIKFAFSKSATVYTRANSTFSQFLQQRKRWANNSLSYNKSFLLSVIFLFLLSIPFQLLLGAFAIPLLLFSAFISFICKACIEYLVLRKGIGLIYDQLKISYFLLAELLHIPYIIIAVIAGAFGNLEWKNRKLN